MAVIRVNKTKDYTVMSNHHLREREMSLKAKGLLSLMLSLPDTWDYSVEGLVSISKESKTAIQATLKELETFNYLERTREQDEKGHFSYSYDIYEKPRTEKPQTENPYTGNQYTEEPHTENVPQLNTKELNTNKSNTNKLNTKDNGAKRPRFKPPTLEEVEAYCLERGNTIDPEQFIDYYEARGWELSKGRKVKDWKACVRTWEKNGYSNKQQTNYKSSVAEELDDFYTMASNWANED